MRKNEIIYYCDKCKKQIKENELKTIFDGVFYYELCEKCNYEYEDYKKKYDELANKVDQLQKKYKFGKYLFEKNV